MTAAAGRMLPELKGSPGCQREITGNCKRSVLLDRSHNETTCGSPGVNAPRNTTQELKFQFSSYLDTRVMRIVNEKYVLSSLSRR